MQDKSFVLRPSHDNVTDWGETLLDIIQIAVAVFLFRNVVCSTYHTETDFFKSDMGYE